MTEDPPSAATREASPGLSEADRIGVESPQFHSVADSAGQTARDGTLGWWRRPTRFEQQDPGTVLFRDRAAMTERHAAPTPT